MKRLFLTILCGVGLSLNLATADTTANLSNVGGGNSANLANSESENSANLPMDSEVNLHKENKNTIPYMYDNFIAEFDDKFENLDTHDKFSYMLLNANLEAIKIFLKDNPTITNLYNNADLMLVNARYFNAKSEKEIDEALQIYSYFLEKGFNSNFYIVKDEREPNLEVSNLQTILFGSRDTSKQINLIDFLINKGLDINMPCIIDKKHEMELTAIEAVVSLGHSYKKDNFELFKYLSEKKIKSKQLLDFVAELLFSDGEFKKFFINKDYDGWKNYIKSDKYKHLRQKNAKYLYEILKNYTLDDLNIDDLEFAMRYFVLADDSEFIKLFMEKGLKNKTEIYSEILKFAQNSKNKNNEILNLLQGEQK